MNHILRVKEIAKHWVENIFVFKNKDYSDSYLLLGKTLELWFPNGVQVKTRIQFIYFSLLVRMLDKIIRASNLVLNSQKEMITDEKVYQTLGDLGIYAFMTSEVMCPDDVVFNGNGSGLKS